MNFGNTGFSFKQKESDLFQQQQTYFRPFKFQETTENLNVRLLDNIDIDRIYYSGDIQLAQAALKNFVSAKLTKKDMEYLTFDQFFKLFRLNQMAMEFYSQSQQQKSIQAEQLSVRLTEVQQKSEKLNEVRLQHQKNREDLIEKMQKYNRKIQDMKEEASRVGTFKCIYCNKTFKQRDALNGHVKRRHQQQLQEINTANDLFKAENPLVKVKKLEEDRRYMQEKLHLTQMQQLQKMHEMKVNEEQVVKNLAKKLDNDLKTKISNAFKDNQEYQKQEEIVKRDEKNKQEMMEHIGQMHEMFGNFERMFDTFKAKQSNMSSTQVAHQQQFDELKIKQQLFESENKEHEHILQEEKQKNEINFKKIQEKNTYAMVRNYMDNLTESVTSDDFLSKAGVVQKKERIRDVIDKKPELNVIGQNYKADIIQFGPLIDDYDSEKDQPPSQDDSQDFEGLGMGKGLMIPGQGQQFLSENFRNQRNIGANNRERQDSEVQSEEQKSQRISEESVDEYKEEFEDDN